MAFGTRQADWRLRKQALILESELNRLTLQAECTNLRAAVGRFVPTGRGRSWLLGLAPVAGIFLVRLLRRGGAAAGGGTGRLSTFLNVVQTASSIWQGFRRKS